jgi:hypothetical protein
MVLTKEIQLPLLGAWKFIVINQMQYTQQAFQWAINKCSNSIYGLKFESKDGAFSLLLL